jgi:hypothetical protein
LERLKRKSEDVFFVAGTKRHYGRLRTPGEFPDSWRGLQDRVAEVIQADLAINAAGTDRAVVIREQPQLWRTYADAMGAYYAASRDVEPWIELTAHMLAANGRRAETPAEMATFDAWLANLEPAVYGDPEARRKLDEQRPWRQKGARNANKVKNRNLKKSRQQRRERYKALMRELLAEYGQEGPARAAATKALAREWNTSVVRARRVVSEWSAGVLAELEDERSRAVAADIAARRRATTARG